MPNENSQDQDRPSDSDSNASYFVDPASGDTLFEQTFVEGEPETTIADSEPAAASKGGKARAKKLGKAKLTAIADRIRRSRPRR
jgi:hypothetical protein